MSNTTQDVKAAGALDAIFNLLFKGIDNILDGAVEYQNDMGKLKQVSKINVADSDGNEYTLVVKLSPLKNKEEMFYVEVECPEFPNFKADKVNEKVLKINKNNKEEFNSIIDELLRDNKLVRTKKGKANEDETSNSYNIQCYDKNKFEDWIEDDGPQPAKIDVHVQQIPLEQSGYFEVILECASKKINSDGYNLDEVKEADIEKTIDKVLDQSKLIRVSEGDAIKDEHDEDMETADQNDVETSSHIDVTLSYVKASDEVKLSAIYANYDLQKALVTLDEAINNDEFANILTEDPQSFRITDEGDQFDVQPIEVVDTCCAQNDIYTSITALLGMLDAYSVDIDEDKQAAATTLINALQQAQTVFKPEPECYTE